MQKDTALLKVEGLTKYYRGLAANENIDLQITEGQIVGLIGPNGAGKSTLFKMISGFNSADRGKIFFEGREIQNKEPYKISRQGIASTFQHAQMFPNLQLLEAVMAGAYGNGKNKSEARRIALEKIRFVGLEGKEAVVSSKLNMFERKKAELAAALAIEPKLILLDELFAGLVPSEVPLMIGTGAQGARIGRIGLHRRACAPRHYGNVRLRVCAGERKADRRGDAGGDPPQSFGDYCLSGG